MARKACFACYPVWLLTEDVPECAVDQLAIAVSGCVSIRKDLAEWKLS